MSAVLGESTAANRQGKMATTSPFKPTSKPTARKSLSALSGDSSNADMNKDSTKLDDMTGSAKIRKRAYSVGGVAVGAPGKKDLSPRSQARRTAKPRKSILKTANAPSVFSPKRQSPQSSRLQTQSRPQASPLRQQTHAHTINFAGSSIPEGEDDMSSDEEDLAIRSASNNYRRNLDMTMPATLPSQGGLAPPRMNGNTTSERKAQRRAEIAAKRARLSVDGMSTRRKSVSWSSHAQVRMIVAQEEEEPKGKPKTAGPAFKIFGDENTAPTSARTAVSANRPLVFATGNTSASGAENKQEGQVSSRIHSSAGAGGSSRRHGRQSSITGLPALQQYTSVSSSAPSGSMFAAPAEHEDSAMDIETDSEEEVDDEQLVQQQLAVTSTQPTPAVPVRSSIFGSPEKVVNNSSRRAMHGRLSVGKTAMSNAEEEQEDMSMDMDITQIVSHGVLQPAGSPASTISGGGNDDDDSDSDSEDELLDQDRHEERTMDFTVAIGGVIPGAPPLIARENRNSVGYTVETSAAAVANTIEYSAPLVDAQQSRPMYSTGIFSIPANRGFDQFSMAPSASARKEDQDNNNDDDDDDMDMEETRAFGGVLPQRDSNKPTNIFLPDPDSSMESIEEVDQEGRSTREPTLRFGSADDAEDDGEAMDFTIAHGGMLEASSRSAIRPRATERALQEDDDDDDGMDFTIARGGVLPAVNVTSPTASTISLANTTQSAPATPKAAAPPVKIFSQEVQPAQATPSYALPTSASRARDIYGPSPSPQKLAGDSPSKPKGRSPATALEVAKKLVFEPSPLRQAASKRKSDASPALQKQSKRKSVIAGEVSVSNNENAPPVAAPVPQLQTSIFASPAKTPAKSPMRVIVPAKSPAKQASIFGTPKRFTGNTLALPSPARGLLPSPAKASALAIPSIQEPEWNQEQYANIPLANFLAMCNVKFSDDGPGARRKSIAGLPPDLLQEMLARDAEGKQGGFTLHDYTRAQIWKPFYDMYQWGCQQMKRDYEAGQETLEAIDKEASEDNPDVIRDYLAASDEEKGVFETVILNLKRNAHLIAREKWYNWKQTLVSQIQPIVEAHMEGLKEDKARLVKVKEEADAVLPAIKARYEALRLELEQEKRIAAEIEACDQDRLVECKAELAQQNSYIAESTAELNEQKAKLGELQKKLAELKTQHDSNLTAIAVAQKECAQQKGFTKAQVYHLQEEYATLQHLHATKVETLQSNELVVCFWNQLRLRLKSHNWKPMLAGALLELVRESTEPVKSAYRMVQRLSVAWGAIQELDQEFKLMALRYPTQFEWNGTTSAVKAKSTIVLPAFKAKINLGFSLTVETITTWPANASNIPVEVELVYGEDVDLEYLQTVAEDVMASVTPESTSGMFRDIACHISAD
ncbi:hypothetical protein QFC19_007340 [Naganishia cerealis]|uniref:Uncharacterized protein n=1 Tax=Naganishia cerealis TaxID=610337 RepID=A0ACC2V9R1_9TREE|nr:hypothetical protein QFC19_007340 [Naganishia cerealis]